MKLLGDRTEYDKARIWDALGWDHQSMAFTETFPTMCTEALHWQSQICVWPGREE